MEKSCSSCSQTWSWQSVSWHYG